MFERIFVDNFRCFVNFEWKPDRLVLLLGENGSGKTTLGRLLWFVRSLVVNEGEVRQWFPSGSRTRWDQRIEQRIELDARLPEGVFQYVLVVEHDPEGPEPARVKRETLHCGGTPLMTFDEGSLQLHDDDGRAGPVFPAHRSRSGLGAVAPSRNNRKLTSFKRWLDEDIWFFKPDPRAMKGRTEEAPGLLMPNLANFAAWYPQSLAQDLEVAFRVKDALAQVFPGFETLGVDKLRQQLQARFRTKGGSSYAIDFRELSDGQRALMALYVLRHAILKPGRVVIFDEPDNYVALKEIQPWLMEVIDVALTSGGPQVWFISHHPELLNRLAPTYGMRLFRHEDGPVRIEPFKGAPGLTPAEAVAREWSGE